MVTLSYAFRKSVIFLRFFHTRVLGKNFIPFTLLQIFVVALFFRITHYYDDVFFNVYLLDEKNDMKSKIIKEAVYKKLLCVYYISVCPCMFVWVCVWDESNQTSETYICFRPIPYHSALWCVWTVKCECLKMFGIKMIS